MSRKKKASDEKRKKAKEKILLRMKNAKKLDILERGRAYSSREELYER